MHADAAANADIWEIRFDRDAKVSVKAGENGGRMLESVNNVTSITRLGNLTPQTPTLTLQVEPLSGDGIAILAQAPGQGKILGAASYMK